MFLNNPFSILAESISPIYLKSFVILMIALVLIGTLIDIIHKKNVKYFFNNAKKAKKSAKREISTGEKVAIISKTVIHDIGTTSELGFGKRRAAHVLGMYGTIIFWISSVAMIFVYSNPNEITPSYWPLAWHLGALLTCIGGFWFWFFLRVDVSAEAHSVFRLIQADLFVLSLVLASTFGLIWSICQSLGLKYFENLFLGLFIVSNLILFGGVYWSKFAHMFYKPGAAIQKNLAEADGSRDNLPEPSDAPEQFGLGIKREQPKHY